MGESLDSVLKDFKYSVVKQRKFFNKLKNLPEYSYISYRQFRTRNISFDVFETAFLGIDNEHLISTPQLGNMFRYLSNNIREENESDIREIVVKIEKARVKLACKLSELDPENDKIIIENIDEVLNELKILKKIIIDPLKNKNKYIEKEIEFDMLLDELLFPKDFNDTNLLPTLFYNLNILDNNKMNGKRFNEKFYKAFLNAVHENDFIKKRYYITLANLVRQANIFTLDRKVINICGFNKYNDARSRLNEKIGSLEYDSSRGRYILKDFIVTIDNENTSKFDDAISVEKLPSGAYILGIHIADVYSLGLLSGTTIDEETILAKSSASLRQKEDRNAISLFVEISKTGLIADKKILMTRITVNNNLLYDDVSRILSNKYDDKLCQTIIDLIGLYNIVNNSKCPDYPGPSAIAHALVQKYMLLYGCVVSDIASKNNYPILYQIDSDKKSAVSLNEVHCNAGFGDNNLNTYARFTSPIWDLRSYINQTSICKCVFDRIDNEEKNILRLKLRNFENEINNGNSLQ